MGGYGSGIGIRPNRKRVNQFIESFPYIDANNFSFGCMQYLPELAGILSIQGVSLTILKDKIIISQAGVPSKGSYEIPFSLTRAAYGNYRYWFECPGCGHRRRKLSLVRADDGMPIFLCRCCLQLVYQSQNRTQGDRIIRNKWRLIQKLRYHSASIPDSAKPKYMHWSTFNRMRRQIEELDRKAALYIASRF